MSSSKDDKTKSAADRLAENFLMDIPEEDRLPENDTPDLIEGTSREIAFIDDDGTICINYFGQKDFVSGRGWEQYKPDDPQYSDYCAKYGLKKPGDSKCLFRRFIDGEWVVVDDEQDPGDSKSVTGTAD